MSSVFRITYTVPYCSDKIELKYGLTYATFDETQWYSLTIVYQLITTLNVFASQNLIEVWPPFVSIKQLRYKRAC